MSDRHTPHRLPMPLWLRLSRWLGVSHSAGRNGSGDSARMDLGYEAAYAPVLTERSWAPSRFEDDRSVPS